MASPHVAGLATLVIEQHGVHTPNGYSLDPATVQQMIEHTATDMACPAGGVEDCTDEGRKRDWNAICEGPVEDNGFYGEGIVNAAAVGAG